MKAQHREMIRRLARLCPEIIPANMSTQEDPLSPLQQQMFNALHVGLTGYELNVSDLCAFYETVEGYYWCIDPHILLGCALDIANEQLSCEQFSSVYEFVDRLLQMQSAAIPPSTFLFEVRNEV